MASSDAGTSSSSGDSFFATFNLRSLGIALAMAWFTAMLFSPAAVSPYYLEAGLDGWVQLLRLVFLVAACAICGAARARPRYVFSRVMRRGIVAGCLILSVLPLVGVVVSDACIVWPGYRALDVLFWMCGGVSGSVMMLVWGFGMVAKQTYGQGIVNVAAGTAFSGVLFVLLSFLQYPVAAVLLSCIPFALFALWIACSGGNPTERASNEGRGGDEQSSVKTSIYAALGKGSTAFVLSSGLLLGFAGSVGTCFSLAGYASLYFGAAAAGSGIVMLVLARTGHLRVGMRTFALFFPFASVCLFGFSLATEAMTAVLLFAVFFAEGACTVLNTAYRTEENPSGAAVPSQVNPADALAKFSSESRFAHTIGIACGWAGGIIVQFAFDGQAVPYGYFLAAIVVSGIASRALSCEHADVVANDENSFTSLAKVWDEGCNRLAQTHGLTMREQDVFLMLSRGRDRQYIHDALQISPNTVRTHAYNLYRKLGVHNQQQLIDLVESELSSSK
ncbi:helix-turn-helix transcriptional regulator [Raoultibacter phocaeensis]|uniref:helix-turn-helix transcriptional regulator n=1 Tax=Raoultibacter phocaeensis TaxID=2479841 RepID=UPI0021084F51|nr:LuxR family transcriptional regulator [Raoultibacter phocaeensis]